MATSHGNNPLVEPASPESSPQVRVHPMVLLAQNDHATRSTVRQHGPIIGAVLGSSDGRDVSLDVAFECGSQNMTLINGTPELDMAWFGAMLKLYGETYPELTLVGWYTFGDEPVAWHMGVHTQFKKTIDGDQALFMLCHHSQLSESDSETKLPFTIYESFRQAGDGMDVDPPYESGVTKFRPITFVSLETSPEEAIVLADVVQLAANASAVQPAPVSGPKTESKGKEKAVDAAEGESEQNHLTAEEEELIQSLATKAASINMLKSRLQVIIDYLQSQSPSYLTDASLPVSTDSVPDHKILRSIYALIAQANLAAPSDGSGISKESAQTQTHVELIGLLSSLTRSMADIRTLGSRQHMVENQKGGQWGPGGIFTSPDFEGFA